MKSLNRAVAILACLGMLSTAFVMLPSTIKDSKAAGPIECIVGTPQSLDNLNPLAGQQNIAYECYMLQFDFLNTFDKYYNPKPAAAQSWSHSTDGKIWTYNIRHGMTFHDDQPVTAADVNWTFNMILTNPAGALYVDLLKNVTDVRALNDYTLQITCNAPKANMLDLMIPILPMHLWSNVPSNKMGSVDPWDATYFPNGPIGSGPFRLVQYVTDSFVKFTTFTGYYGGAAHFDDLILNIYLNPQTMLNDITAGTIDAAVSVPKESWTMTLSKDHIQGQTVPQPVFHEFGFNVCPINLRVGGASTNYETLNLSVRKAVAMAIDKQNIVQQCYFGLGELGTTVVPPVYGQWHYNVSSTEEYKFDIVAANALLNASGYMDLNSDGTRENVTSGKALNFNFLYATEYPEDQSAATRISNWLARIGITATPVGELESQLYTDWIGMKYDMFMWNWGCDVDPTFILSVLTTGQIPTSHNDWSAWSDSFYSNPTYDQLFAQQQTTIDHATRQQLVYEMQRMVYKDSPYVVLCYPYGLYAYRDDKFTNWPTMPTDANSPYCGTAGSPQFYLDIIPIGSNYPPTSVSAGQSTTVGLNETRSFTGSAYDPENDPLTWTWQFAEPNGTVNTLLGQTVQYTFRNLGAVTVTLSVSDGYNSPVSAQITVTVIHIANAGWLIGYVKDTGARPLMAAVVSVTATSVTTNASGYYNMTLSAGTYNVTATAQGYRTAWLDAVVAENHTTTLNFSLTSTSGTLIGHIYDAKTGLPLSNATVSVTMGQTSKNGVSNTSGGYRIPLLPAGTYNLSALKSGYTTNTTSVAITSGQETVLDIHLSPVKAGGAKGLSGSQILAIGAVVAVVAIAVVAMLMMMKRRRRAEQSPPAAEPPKT